MASSSTLTLPGFTITDEVHRGRTRSIYRAIRQRDGESVIVKTTAEGIPSRRAINALKHEWGILRDLDIDGVIHAHELIQRDGRSVLVLEDRGGEPLRRLLRAGPLDISRALRVGVRLTAALGAVHRHQIIHKDINPSNIIVDPETLGVTLIDFGIASRLPVEHQQLSHPSVLEGTVAYMSPEQTGRMNRDIDFRTDFYSLGVTLYEMVTGCLPFESDDLLEVVHGHIARPPRPPRDVNDAIPKPLSDLILKLLAKTAEDRYQSALGLETDLAQCLAEWQASGRIVNVVPGDADCADQFMIPQQLYGRDREIVELLAAFERASNNGVGLMLVSGYSGIGKTSLIHELHKSLTHRRGYFTAGKFDQLVRNVPYGGIAQAFHALVRQLLTESESAVSQWRNTLRDAFGANAQVIVEVVPELERLLGPQPPVPPLGATEAQNRFNLVFQRLLGAVADRDHPLVIFLDDMQWADSATLSLLQAFLVNHDLRGLLVIGAYRDNEVTETHPLMRMLADLRERGASIEQLSLNPLVAGDVHRLIGDTLHSSLELASPLATLVMEKTAGNPFFVTQFLKTLHRDGLLAFNYDRRRWSFDLDRIRAMQITDNVVDLMAANIRKLPDDSQKVLKLAACIGNRFDLRTVATVRRGGVHETAREMWSAVSQGLVVPLDSRFAEVTDEGELDASAAFRFLHDRVQQAAYDLIPEAERPAMHLTIGRLMLGNSTAAERDERLFDIVDQLNYGIPLLSDAKERLDVVQLNLAAGRKAKASAAYRTARSYFAAAASVLDDHAWSQMYDLTFSLYVGLAECEYLCGNFERAEIAYDTLLKHAQTSLDEAEVHRLRTVQYENMSKYPDAIQAARDGLRLFGIAVPGDFATDDTALDGEVATVNTRLAGRSIDSLVDLPKLEDPQVKMAMRLLLAAWAPAYIAGDQGLSAWLPAKMVQLSLQHGNTEESACGYVIHGITVGSRYGDYATGHAFGRLALEVNSQLNDLTSRAKVHEQFSCFVHFWREPMRSCFRHSRASYHAGLESGDFTYATYAVFHESWYAFLTSRDLSKFQEEYRGTVAFLKQIRMDSFADAQQLILQWAAALQDRTNALTDLSGDAFDEVAYCHTWAIPFFHTFFFVVKSHLHLAAAEPRAARDAAQRAEEVVGSLTGTIWPALLTYYHALAITACHESDPPEDRSTALETLDQLERKLAAWAENCAANFAHQHALVRAERARITGHTAEAIEGYEAAIAAASKSDFPYDHALANELYGQFWSGRGDHRIAGIFLSEAHHAYARLGATGKAKALAERFAPILRASKPAALTSSALSTTETGAGVLDLETVMKAAHLIAAEIELSALLSKLMRILVENAGAQRGMLLLGDSDGNWLVQAETAGPDQIKVQHSVVPTERILSEAVVNFVRRTAESVVIADAVSDPAYGHDAYIRRERPKSILCTPILHRGQLAGAVYLENNLVVDAFTTDRIQVIQMLSTHAATAIHNAELFAEVTRLHERLEAENVYLHEEIKSQHGFDDIVGDSVALRQVLQRVEQVAPTDTSVLITGETGTGKELIARAIHSRSPRRDKPLITLNCGAIAGGVVESELFGHEKGAFTGALTRKLGRFELASGGTIFLDEIGDLPLDLQVKLLRVLQEGEIERVGGTSSIKVDVRVIAATHMSLDEAVRNGRFRPDLYYRLNVFPIASPPLRERPDDIPLLVRFFVRQFGAKLGKPIETVPKRTLDTLVTYPWPGNIRELRNVIERLIIISTGTTLELGDWDRSAPQGTPVPEGAGSQSLEDIEREHILQVLQETGWRVSGPKGAATRLGLKRTTLEARMKRLGIVRPR